MWKAVAATLEVFEEEEAEEEEAEDDMTEEEGGPTTTPDKGLVTSLSLSLSAPIGNSEDEEEEEDRPLCEEVKAVWLWLRPCCAGLVRGLEEGEARKGRSFSG